MARQLTSLWRGPFKSCFSHKCNEFGGLRALTVMIFRHITNVPLSPPHTHMLCKYLLA